MTEAEKEKLEVADAALKDEGAKRKDSEEIPAWADSFMKRVDARLDAMDKKDARKDEGPAEDPTETSEGKPKKDAAPAEAEDKARKDAEAAHAAEEKEKSDKARKDAEEREDRARKDAQSVTDNRAIQAKIAEMDKRIGDVYKEPSFEDRNEISAVRSRADSVYQALTGRPVSEPIPGESPIAYRKRVADGLRKFSGKFKDTRLDSLSGPVFEEIEDRIYLDAMEAIKSPSVIEPGMLRPITRNDSGHQITEYVGDAKVTWAPFQAGSGMIAKLTKPSTNA
ncbi:MAG: hypothetical protein ACYCS8_17460 [Acidithiobacillus sp.]